MDPQPGESIIDCCAAPGGKTLNMASRLSGQGISYSKIGHFNSLELIGTSENEGDAVFDFRYDICS